MVRFSQFLKEAVKQKPKAADVQELMASIKNGVFTKDGSHLRIDGNFTCQDMQMTSLVGAPYHVGGNFLCSDNKLTSLEGAPKFVGKEFDCCNNALTSLEGAPDIVGRSFYCSDNVLTSLKGGPVHGVGETYDCSNNDLTTLEGGPKIVGERFVCGYNPLKSLKGAPEQTARIECYGTELKFGLLSLFKIRGLQSFVVDNNIAGDIVNTYLPNTKGNQGVMNCQNELLDAGFEIQAEL